jgi:hypothetical protein
MTDSKTIFRNLLINSVPLTSLVPAARIFYGWPDNFNTLPLIAYVETNNFTSDMDYFDDQPVSETVEFTVHIFTAPSTSPTEIAHAVDDVLVQALWNRDSGTTDLKEPDSGLNHRITRYSTRLMK